jgi:hypothetical protein
MRFRNPNYNYLGMVRRCVTTPVRRTFHYGRAAAGPPVHCPEAGHEIAFAHCLGCERFAVWNAQDEIRRCWHEYKDLEARGYYDGTWDEHPENFDAQTFAGIQERKKINAEFAGDFELDKAKMAELARALEDDEEEGDESAPANEDDDEY